MAFLKQSMYFPFFVFVFLRGDNDTHKRWKQIFGTRIQFKIRRRRWTKEEMKKWSAESRTSECVCGKEY